MLHMPKIAIKYQNQSKLENALENIEKFLQFYLVFI